MKIRSSWSVLAAWCAFAASPTAQNEPKPRRDEPQSRRDARLTPRQLVRSGAVLGAEVRDQNDEKLGSIKELGVAPDSCDVLFVVVSTGGVLGIGDKEYVLGCNFRSFDVENKRCVLETTKADLPKAAAYDPNLLDEYYQRFARKSDRRARPGDASARREPDGRRESEPKQLATIKGKVTAVDRNAAERDNCVVADVVDDGNRTHRVVLGPETWLKEQGVEPVVGDHLEVAVADAGANTRQLVPARVVKRAKDGQAIQLRDLSGRAVWDGPCCVLLSKIDDAKVLCENEKVGTVGEVFCDVQNGKLPFFTLATDDFGASNAIYLIPWSAVRTDKDHAVHLRISKLQMKSAPRLSSKEATEVDDPDFCRRVDEFYPDAHPGVGPVR